MRIYESIETDDIYKYYLVVETMPNNVFVEEESPFIAIPLWKFENEDGNAEFHIDTDNHITEIFADREKFLGAFQLWKDNV